MPKTKFDPFKNLILDEEEQALEAMFEKGKFKSQPNFEERKKLWEKAAANYFKLQKSKKITIRINQLDLFKVKNKAKKNNIPYQTLLSTLIHQFADGKIKVEI